MPLEEIVRSLQKGPKVLVFARNWRRCFEETGSTAAEHWTAVCDHSEVPAIAREAVRLDAQLQPLDSCFRWLVRLKQGVGGQNELDAAAFHLQTKQARTHFFPRWLAPCDTGERLDDEFLERRRWHSHTFRRG